MRQTTYNTKRMIADVFKSLIQKKHPAKITVSEIIEKAQINKRTFYYHFNDKNDLLVWMVKDDIEQQIQDLLETNREKAVNTILAYVKENHRFLVEVHECMEKELISFRIYRPLADLVSQYIQNVLQENNVHIDEEYFRVLTHTFTIAAAALLLDWAYKYDKIEALQYDEYSYPLLENLIKTAILNPPKGEAE